MNERDNQSGEMGYDEKALILSRYADIVILDETRQSHGREGIYADFEQVGYSLEIEEGELADLFLNNLMDPPNRIFVAAATSAPTLELPEGRRTLAISVFSKDVQTDYCLNFRPTEIQPIEFYKTVERVYGLAEYGREGQLLDGSEMREPVSSGPVSNSEIELLYVVLSYITSKM